MKYFNQTITKLLPLTLKRKLPFKVVIIEIGKQESRRWNQEYRSKKEPTNVLSFLYGPDYGEILVCPEIIRKEAKSQGNSYKYQMTWMILHGMIHLAGIHHEQSKRAAKKLETIEENILNKLFG